jgi:hypothetical protein
VPPAIAGVALAFAADGGANSSSSSSSNGGNRSRRGPRRGGAGMQGARGGACVCWASCGYSHVNRGGGKVQALSVVGYPSDGNVDRADRPYQKHPTHHPTSIDRSIECRKHSRVPAAAARSNS